MFTGLIETVQIVHENRSTATGRQLVVPLGQLSADATRGDSISVNGVCLTISDLRRQGKETLAIFDVMAETVRASTLEGLKAGSRVNMERAMAAGGRFGGHFVQGHVDGIGVIDRIERDRSKFVLWIAAPPEIMKYMIPKGSVAIDGVSLTLVDVETERFSVWLIPTTGQETNLGDRQIGDKINLEADLIGKWINKRLDDVSGQTGSRSQVSMEALRDLGFA